MKKIKVLMLVPNLFVANGVASFVMNYLRNLDHDEVQVDIASYKEGASIYYAEVENAGGKVEELPKLQGSKYVQSSMNDSYQKVKRELQTGREVLFCGVPCQVEVLKQLLIVES